ncbi:MAG: tail fiber protein [Actinomycetota bacterium]|nr:tail fiber protein [Actinomycetota bacterium]
MSTPYIGEIRMFGGNFAPLGWAFCNGQSLSISENEALFTLIGTTYGGDGQSTFNLPNLQGRLPLHQGAGYQLGQSGGVPSVTLTVDQTPSHGHPLRGSVATAAGTNPQGTVFAHLPDAGVQTAYGSTAPFGAIDPSSVAPAGGSQPHSNMQPCLAVNFIIALEGVFPTQN